MLKIPIRHPPASGPGRPKRWSRRAVLEAGGLSLLGLNSVQLERLRAAPDSLAPRANSCVFLFLFGGPSQIDLWDMKPQAPPEVRGEFQPVSTSVPGIQVCEHLPQLARQMDKVCLLRSMTHAMNVHGPACSEVLSGREYFGAPTTDQESDQDWPSLSSMAMRYGVNRQGFPPSVVLPWYLQFPGQARRIAGQTGGRMGSRYDAMLLAGDSDRFHADGLHLADSVSLQRVQNRRRLLDEFQNPPIPLSTPLLDHYKRHRERAYELLMQKAGTVIDISKESPGVRKRYGKTMMGQSLLMARRLLEAGVSLVTVNWQDETKTDGVNTCWDTHQNNFAKLKDLLCPIFDQCYTAFIEDLHQRGLLETTLVVAIGEFGRTPHLGQFSQSNNTRKTGRDHWPSAFTALLAGGGIRGGQVYGATNHHAALVKDRPVSPADLAATIMHHLGIDATSTYTDEVQGLAHQLSDGRVITDL